LNPGNAALVEIIREEIRQAGPIPFAHFMKQALYHPEYGYYSSDRAALGRRGDYFTNVSVGQTFGQLLALQFVEIWQALEKAHDFVLVEQGAHHGEFAGDVLQSIRDISPEMFMALRYRIIEPFPRLRDCQSEVLAEFRDKVDWCESIEALEPFVGLHFNNELLDALPVRLVCSRSSGSGSSWMERRVALDHHEFILVDAPMMDPALRAHAARLPPRPPGYETEINLAAPEWIRQLSAKLTRGYIMMVDYGFSRARFYDEERVTGTIQTRAEHRLLESPLVGIGQSDITAHVEWTSLVEEGEMSGLSLQGFTDQHHFLTGLLAASPAFAEKASPKTRRELQSLLHPEMLGRSFQVLAFGKGVTIPGKLSGFRFARDARSAL
jgi:SAM-dependent MidA family methyltransferase